MEEIRNVDPSAKNIPSRTFCRTFFESYPSIHQWKELYKNDEIVNIYENSCSNETDKTIVLTNCLKVFCYYITLEKYNSAFKVLSSSLIITTTLPEDIEVTDDLLAALALQNEMLGCCCCCCCFCTLLLLLLLMF